MRHTDEQSASVWPQVLFLAVVGSYWITMTPFADLSRDPALSKPAWWTLALTIAIFLLLIAYTLRSEFRKLVARPRVLLSLIFGWLLLTAALSDDPVNAMRRVI